MKTSRKVIAKKRNREQRGKDNSSIQNQIGSEAKAHNLKNKVKLIQDAKKQAGLKLFKVEAEPDQDLKKALDKDRFQKKKIDLPVKIELQLKAMAHNTQRHEKFRAEEKEVISVPKKANPLDIWGTTAPSKTANGRQNRVLGAANKVGITQVPNILTPHGGESYNPSGDAHQALLQTIVNIDDKLVNGIQMPSRVKDLSKFDAQSKKAKPRSKKEAKILEELEIKRKIKENVLMEYNYGKFLKDANKDKKDQSKILILISRKKT